MEFAVGDAVSWTTAKGTKATGKVVQIVKTGTLRPPVGPAIPAPACLVQMGPMKLAVPAGKLTKVAAAAAADAPPAPVTPDTPFGGLAPTVTLHDVELCRVGTWQASTGTASLSDEDLTSALEAAADPEVDRAPVHPGHFDARFSIATDGEPALGWVVPRRVENGRLIGDLVDVPAKLAAIIPKAYARRSVELAFGVKTAAGKTYRAVVTGLGLLGVQAPAVKGLADVVARYSLGDADYEVVEFAVGEALVAAAEAPATRDTPGQGATSTTSALRSAHDQSQQVTDLGGTVPRFTDDRLRALLGLSADHDVAAIQAAIDGGASPADALTSTQGGGTQPAAPDATATTGIAPTSTAPAQDAAVANGDAPATGTATVPAVAAAPAATGAVAAGNALQLPEGVVLLSQGQLDDLLAKANAGQSAAEQLAAQRRDGIITTALSEGRLAVAEREVFRQRLDADEAGTVALLSALQPGRVPVTPQGHAGDASATDAATSDEDAAFAAFSQVVYGLPARQPAAAGQ